MIHLHQHLRSTNIVNNFNIRNNISIIDTYAVLDTGEPNE